VVADQSRTRPPANRRVAAAFCRLTAAGLAWAGPPYVTDDPGTTEEHHYEIYSFATGTRTRDGADGAVLERFFR